MGLDLSIRGTGIVVADMETTTFAKKILVKELVQTESPGPKGRPSGKLPNGTYIGTDEERIAFVVRRVMQAWNQYEPVVVGIEGYAFSKNTNAASKLYELGGVVKYRLFRNNALVNIVTSTDLKHWVTGNGRADKQRMYDAAESFGIGDMIALDKGGDNIADAFHVARHAAWTLSYQSA